MKRKKTVLILVLILLAALVALGAGSMRKKPKDNASYCTDDYSEIYKNQLHIIFGEDYVIGEKETIVIEGEDCDCGYHTNDFEYDEWKISYQDQNGQTYEQTLDNKSSLEAQQLSWLASQLEQYYTQKYLIDFFEEGTFEDLSCYVTIGSPVGSYTSDQKEEFERIKEAGKGYKEQLLKQLQEEKNMLRLQEVDYKNIFNCYPVKVNFHLCIDDGTLSGVEKEDFEKAVQERVMEMIQAIKQETGDTCNLRIQVNSAHGHCDLYDGSRDWRYFILQGEQIKPENTFDGWELEIFYAWSIFYAYEGIYW